MNKVNTNDQLNRMKSLMNYGLQTESKQAPYSTIEYKKVGADGKVYGIVREGTKYYIKSAPNKQNLIKEDFNYIGGFRNRKDHEYGNFALAQKQFDLKMMSLKEAANNPKFNVESWDLNKKELIVTEASDKMKGEILRERQIMKNAMSIMENKALCCDDPCTPKNNINAGTPETGDANGNNVTDGFDQKVGNEFQKQGKDNIKKTEESKNVNGNPVNEEEVLGWNRNKDYMDKSHGTEIGDSAPFDGPEARNIDDQDKKVTNTGEMKNGVVENHGTSMHDTDNQNSPAVGVGEGPSDDNNKPFDDEKGKQIDEALEMVEDLDDVDGGEGEDPLADEDPVGEDPEMGGEPMGEPVDTDGLGDDEGLDDDGLGDEGLDDDFGDEDLEGDDVVEDDLEQRISSMEDLLMQIADKLGIQQDVDANAYGDDDLFGDEGGEEDFGGEDEFGDEGGEEPDFGGEDLGGEGEVEPDEDIEDGLNRECGFDPSMRESRQREEIQIFETAAYRRAMGKQRVNEEGMTPFKDAGRVPSGNMNKLDDFGKHPAYQKVVMDLPPKDIKEFPGNYDMNDDSVKNDTPYGEKIGDGAPFDIDPEAIDNAIAEAFNRLKKKSNRR